MKKKVLLVLLLAVLATAGSFAQATWYNTYAPGVDENMFFVNAGVGFGPTGGYQMGIPPITASVDFKLPISLPITVGAFGTLSTWKFSYPLIGGDLVWRNIGFGVRGHYHFNFLENLDTYAGLSLGYVLQSLSYTGGGGNGDLGAYGYNGANFFLWGGNIGARYFFTDLLGAYLELGYSGLQFASIGVSLKF